MVLIISMAEISDGNQIPPTRSKANSHFEILRSTSPTNLRYILSLMSHSSFTFAASIIWISHSFLLCFFALLLLYRSNGFFFSL